MIYLKSFLVFSVILIIFFSPISDLSALDFKVKEREKIEKSFVLGLKLFKDELYIPATEVFSEFLINNKDNSKKILARFLLAESFRNIGKFELAKKNLQFVLAKKRKTSEVLYLKSYIRLGEIHDLQGNTLKASVNYENAFDYFNIIKSKDILYLSPLIKKNFLRASFARYAKEDCQRAIENFKKLEKYSDWKNSLLEKDYNKYLFVKGDCALKLDKFELSKLYFAKILKSKTSLDIREQTMFRLAISLDGLKETQKSFLIYLEIANQKKARNLEGFIFSLWRLSEISEERMSWKESIKYLKLLRIRIEKKRVEKDGRFSDFYVLSQIRIKEIKNFLHLIKERKLQVKIEKVFFQKKVEKRKKKIREIERKHLKDIKKRDREILNKENSFREALVNYKNKVRKLEEEYLRKVELRSKKIRALRLENIRKIKSYKNKVRELEREYFRKVKNREKDVHILKLENMKKLEAYKKKVRQLDQKYLRKVKEREEKIRLQEEEYRKKVIDRKKFIRSREPLFR